MAAVDEPSDGGAPSAHLLALPDEVVDVIYGHAAAALDGPATVVRCACSCTTLHRFCSSEAFAQRRGAERDHAGIRTLAQLAVLEALQNIGPKRVVFEGASVEIRTGSLARLDDIARLLRLHGGRLRVSIEAHTGRYAPDDYAPFFTRSRAAAVAAHLAELGVDKQAIGACNGWGKRIAVAAGWQPGIESARADMFFTIEGLELPPRPGYYSGVRPYAEDEDPVERVIRDYADSESSDDEAATTASTDLEGWEAALAGDLRHGD